MGDRSLSSACSPVHEPALVLLHLRTQAAPPGEPGKGMFLALTCLCYNVRADIALPEILWPLTNYIESKGPGW